MHKTFAEAVAHVAQQSTDGQGRRLTVGQIADRIGRTESYLGKAVSQYDEAHPLRGDLIVPLTLATKNYAVVEHLSKSCGGVFFLLPEVTTDGHLDVIEQTGRAVSEFGDVLRDLHKTLADGIVTAEESHRVDTECQEAIAEILRLNALIKSKVKAEPAAPLHAVGGRR